MKSKEPSMDLCGIFLIVFYNLKVSNVLESSMNMLIEVLLLSISTFSQSTNSSTSSVECPLQTSYSPLLIKQLLFKYFGIFKQK